MSSSGLPSVGKQSGAGSTENSPKNSSSKGKTDAGWAHCVTITCEDGKNGHEFAAVKEKKKRANDDAFGEDRARERINEFRSRIPDPKKSKAAGGETTHFVRRTTQGTQLTIKSMMQNKEAKEECDLAISRWMIDANIPFNAVNSTFYQPMIDAIASMGQGYKGPKYHAMRNYLLGKHVIEAQTFVDSFRSIWKETGCTIMADVWSDTCERTFINFLAYCPRGMVFIKSVDASEISKSTTALFDLFKEVVFFVGVENVVHIVTVNDDNYIAAGKLLEVEFPSLYWSPCAAHCLNLMLQDIEKLDEVSAVMLQASNITKYVYNHSYPLHLMRKFTGGREIIRPAPTQFARNFIALQSILSQKDGLRAMVTSKEWTLSAYGREVKGRMFEDCVLNPQFWKECAIVVQVTEPLIRVLDIVNSEERPAMGYIYSAIQKAREEIELGFERRKNRAGPYLQILDSHWDRQLHKNLHAAGHWLNPRFQYKNDGQHC